MTQSFHFLVAPVIFSVVFVVTIANPTPTTERSPITQDAPSQLMEGDNITPSQQAEGESDAESQQAEEEIDASSQQAGGESDAESQQEEGESDAESQQAEGESDAESQQAEGESDAESQQAEGESDAESQQAEGEIDASSQQAEGEIDASSQEAEGESDAETQQAEGESEKPSNKNSRKDPTEPWHAVEGVMAAVKTLIKSFPYFSYQLVSGVEKNLQTDFFNGRQYKNLQTVKDLESQLQTREESLLSSISDDLKSQLETRDETLQTNISDLKSLFHNEGIKLGQQLNTTDETLQSMITDLESRRNAREETLQSKITKLESQLNTREATLQSKIAGLEETVQHLTARVLPEVGEAKLVDGTQNEGFVLVYTGEPLGWGLVCDDHFDTSNVGATVVCKQLGYRSGSFRQAEAPSTWVTDRYKIVLDNVKCSSGDTSLTQCGHALGVHDCKFKEAVRVACSG